MEKYSDRKRMPITGPYLIMTRSCMTGSIYIKRLNIQHYAAHLAINLSAVKIILMHCQKFKIKNHSKHHDSISHN